MKVFKEDPKQQEKLEEFYKNENIFFPDTVVLNFVAKLMITLAVLVNAGPWLASDRYLELTGCMFFGVGMSIYSSKYAAFTEGHDKKKTNFADLTRYLPVNRMQLTIFRIKKVLKPCLILTALVVTIRLMISFGIWGSATIWDVLIPIGGMIVLPVLCELPRY